MTREASEKPAVTDGGGEDTMLTTQGETTNGSAISKQAEFSLIVVFFALVVAATAFKN